MTGSVALERPVRFRNGRPHFRIAESDDEKRNLPLAQLVHQRRAVAGELIPVGEQQNASVAAGRRLERLFRDPQRGFEVGAAQWNGVGVEFVDILRESQRIRSQRTGKIRLARESDQSETVVGRGFHQLAEQEFRMFEPGRRDVGRQHAFRHVENHHQVAAARFERHQLRAPERTRRRHDQEKHGHQQQEDPEPPSRRGQFDRRRVGIAVAEQSPDFLFSAMRCVDRQYDYRQQDRQHQIKQLWLDEPHRYSLLICRITIITPQ